MSKKGGENSSNALLWSKHAHLSMGLATSSTGGNKMFHIYANSVCENVLNSFHVCFEIGRASYKGGSRVLFIIIIILIH